MKILLVDDNADDRRLLRYICEMHGFRDVILARDGQEGLEMARIHKPDLIISDALMPNMDGFQFLWELKRDNTLQSIPFVFYSATYIGQKEAELAASLGAEAFIVKPTEPEEFWQKLKEVIDKSNQIKAKTASSELAGEEKEYLSRYSHIVATKLEEKIRELEDAKKELELSDAFVKKILESVDEGFIVINRNFQILSANRAYANMTSMPLEKIIGKHCYEVSHHASVPCFETGYDCAVKKVFETRQTHAAIYEHKDSKGGAVYIETKAYPHSKDSSGEVTTVIETLLDTTERHKLEEQLRQAQKMESIGTLAGGIAHDFNNILTAIIGYGRLALMKMATDNPQRINIEHMLEGAERAAHLTKDLLLFSRKQISERRTIDLNEIIRKIEKFLTRIIGEDILCKTVLHSGTIPILADAHQLEQVLMNLATNARDAMPKGGVFSVTTGPIRFDEEFITAHGYGQPGMYALITVSDTGSGMDEATRQRIFEPFFTTKGLGKGTGLGLAVVYGIVKGHDGYINIYSEPGVGTIFRIYLPLTTIEAEATLESIKPIAPGKGETILIAEDETNTRRIIKLILEAHGYMVMEAENGEDAVKRFRDNPDKISLVLLDVLMPVKTGMEAWNEIRGLSPDIKVVFISGYTNDIITAKGLLEEGVEFISKPIYPDALLRKIRETLDKDRR